MLNVDLFNQFVKTDVYSRYKLLVYCTMFDYVPWMYAVEKLETSLSIILKYHVIHRRTWVTSLRCTAKSEAISIITEACRIRAYDYHPSSIAVRGPSQTGVARISALCSADHNVGHIPNSLLRTLSRRFGRDQLARC